MKINLLIAFLIAIALTVIAAAVPPAPPSAPGFEISWPPAEPAPLPAGDIRAISRTVNAARCQKCQRASPTLRTYVLHDDGRQTYIFRCPNCTNTWPYAISP